MKRLLIMLLLLAILLVGCESAEDKAAKEQMRKQAAERAAAVALEKQQLINDTISNCTSIEDEYDNVFCFSDSALAAHRDDVDIIKDACKASADSDLCFFSIAAKLRDRKRCSFVTDQISCNMLSSDNYCNKFDNGDECYESQIMLMAVYDYNRAKSLCKTANMAGPLSKVACAEVNEDDYSNLSSQTRTITAYTLAKMMDFTTETVRTR